MSKSGPSSRRDSPPPTHARLSDDRCYNTDSDSQPCCPLCLEEMDSSDVRFKPCPCGYQVCRFCWHRIREEGNERCPACRRIYTDEDVEFLPEDPTFSTSGDIAGDRRGRHRLGAKGKSSATSPAPPLAATAIATTEKGILTSRRHLVELRVIQKNLVYVVGISARIAHESILREPEFFGQFGKIVKIVVNRKNTGEKMASSPLLSNSGTATSTTTSGSAYVTYYLPEDAARAIEYIDGCLCDGRVIRATYGTTKYCSHFLRGSTCPNVGCMYLHEEGDISASYTKEQLNSGRLNLHGPNKRDTFDADGGRNERIIRHFGTIMYRPAATIEAANGTTAITANATFTTAATTTTTTGNNHPKSSSPINLFKCKDEATNFLNRLSKWDSSPLEDLLGEGMEKEGFDAREMLASLSLLEGSTFDPFDEEEEDFRKAYHHYRSQASWSQALGNGHSKTIEDLRHHFFVGEKPLLVKGGTAGTNGSLPGFEWNNGIYKERGTIRASATQKQSQPQQQQQVYPQNQIDRWRSCSSDDGLAVFRRPGLGIGSTIKIAPVGSPFREDDNSPRWNSTDASMLPSMSSSVSTLPSSLSPSLLMSSPTPVTMANLDQIFGMAANHGRNFININEKPTLSSPSSSSVTTGSNVAFTGTKKAVDATMLERQFFRDAAAQPAALVKTPSATAITTSTVKSSPTEKGIIEEKPSGLSNVDMISKASSGVKMANKIVTTLPPAPIVSSPLTSTKKKLMANKKDGATGGTTKKPPTTILNTTMTSPSPPTSAITAAAPTTAASSLSSSLSLNDKEREKIISPAKITGKLDASMAGIKSKSNLFAALMIDNVEEDAEQDSSSDDTKPSTNPSPVKADEPNPNRPSLAAVATANQKKKKNKKGKSLTDNIGATPLVRPTLPTFSLQPDYQLSWPTNSNGYATVTGPRLDLMSEGERNEWRHFLEEDLRCGRAEEAALRTQVNRLHSEFCSWVKSLKSVSLPAIVIKD